MISRPTVSVVMPVYNRERWVRRAIKSILKQEFEDFEIIVVDDGSSDRTLQFIESFDDPRMKVVTLPANLGCAGARNAGIEIARGEFIATMDSDDVALPDRLGRQVSYLQVHPDIDILGSNIVKCQSNGRIHPVHSPEDAMFKARLLILDGSSVIHPTTMLRKSFLDKHQLVYPHEPTDEDHALWIEAMACGAKFAVLEDRLLEYHLHGNNSASSADAVASGHEARKTPLRARILGLFFPDLSQTEVHAIANWMEVGRRNRKQDVLDAMAAIGKAAMDTTSRLGESKAEVMRILNLHLTSAEEALAAARSASV